VPQRIIPLWRFDNLNDAGQARVPHDPAERLRSDLPFRDPFVSVHARTPCGTGVVEMEALKELEPG